MLTVKQDYLTRIYSKFADTAHRKHEKLKVITKLNVV